MKKPDPIEQTLDRLSQLCDEPKQVVVEELRRALNHRSNLVAAKAAKIAGELRLTELMPDLAAGFERFMADPVRLDKRCAAVTEAAAALYEMDCLDPQIYLRGIRHVQFEASYGPPVDEAAKLRAQCALGLIRTSHPDAFPNVVDLLADPQPQARIGAVRALAACGGEKGVLLLRFKVLTGDREAEVLGECFAGLLEADFDRSLEFVRRYVDSEDEEIAETAILALATQRRPEAFAVLREKWERTVTGSLRQTLLAAMGTARLDEATDFLLGLVGEASVPTAVEVIKTLAHYHNDERVRAAIKKIVDARNDRQLAAAFQAEF